MLYNLVLLNVIRYVKDYMSTTVLIKKRRKAAMGIPKVEEILRGSVVVVKRYCGKTNCRCRDGFKHRALYVSQRNEGKARMIYIPQRSEKEVRRLIGNYNKLKAVMNKISEVNIKMLTTG